MVLSTNNGLTEKIGMRAALRLPAILFFLLTAWFGLLSYIPFAYLQFLRHLLFAWLEFFVLFHHWLFWSAFLLALLSIADHLVARRPSAWAFAALFGMAGIWLWLYPILPGLGNDRRSLVVGLIALVAPAWLAALDHVEGRRRIGWLTETPRGGVAARALRACLWTAIYVWASFSLIAALRILRGGNAQLGITEHLLAVGWSFLLHIGFAAAGFFFLAAISVIWRKPRSQYIAIMTGLAIAGWVVLTRLVFPSIAFQGAMANAIAAILGAWGAFVWSGLAVRRTCDLGSADLQVGPNAPDLSLDPLDIAVSPIAVSQQAAAAASLVALMALAYIAVESVAKTDWYFLLQKLIACLTWMAAFAILYRFSSARSWSSAIAREHMEASSGETSPKPGEGGKLREGGLAAVLMAVSVVIVLSRMLMAEPVPSSQWELAVDRYAPYDASLTLIDQLMTPRSKELADITRLLVAQANPEGEQVQPASIDFAKPLNRSAAPRPHIFLFVIDSLRRDYLSPYNPEVTFTPGIQSFAAESIVFTRAFTRYSGTGLSEPAIWSGALLPHKQYVTPFAPMNALEKLLNAEGYHRLISVDSILKQLLSPSSVTRELDAGVQNRLYDTCRTLDEIRAILPVTIRAGHPLFAFTQSQDIHVANVAIDRSQRAGPAFAGFYAPYAARLQRLDACFGSFINHLKQVGIYDNTIVVLTSDHGDSLGDEGRWGHSFTVFPEVIRVPLIVHLPERLKAPADPDAVAFTTDITPSFYALLGHRPVVRDPLFGMALIGADGETLAVRQRRPYLVASSYGPVYGLVSQNGRYLYVIDAVNMEEHQYDLSRRLNGERIIVTDTDRANAWKEIRAQLTEVATFYSIRK